MDPYTVLEIPSDASDDDIKKAYKTLAIKWHPDKNKDPNAAEKFKEISEAYQMLTDPDKKNFHSKSSLSELFENLDYDIPIQVSYLDLILGATKTMKITENVMVDIDGNIIPTVVCPQCQGQRIFLSAFGLTCSRCRDTGKVPIKQGYQAKKSKIIEIKIPEKSWPGRMIQSDTYKILLEPLETEDMTNQGLAIIYNYPITVYEALAGMSKDIKVLDLTHHIEHLDPISPDEEIVIENSGLYNPHGKRGPLVIRFDHLFPRTITEEQRTLIQRCIELEMSKIPVPSIIPNQENKS